MSEIYLSGTITHIQNQKNKATIEYLEKNKTRTIQALIDDKEQSKWIEQKLIKKQHRFLVGDYVKFVIRKSGGGFYATNVIYQYNNELNVLINKASISNKFLGYIKIVEDQYFIKEIDSYLFFPLKISKYEIPPTAAETAKPISFKLENIDRPEKITAALYNHQYTPDFLMAIKQSKKTEPINATVNKITPYGIFVMLAESNINAKIPLNEQIAIKVQKNKIEIGTSVLVKIKILSTEKIVLELVD